MKRILTLFAAALAVVGCSHDEVVAPNIPTEKPTYYATFADAEGESRTYLDEHLKLLWHNDDRISLFQTTYNEEYAFADPTGSNSGAFNAVESDNWVTGNQTSTTYAVYPYNAANALSNSEVLTIHFAAEQTYAEDSFGRGANTMVAATESATSKLLPFRNAGGYLMLKLYGENKTVKSIELKGNNDEVISGAATAEAKYGYLPSITMGAEGGKTITLTCEEAVTLGATEEEATVFWLVVPPVTFEKGFTITVTDANGGTYTKSTSKSTTIERNTVKPMAALNPTFEGDAEDPESIPDTWKIYYTATAKVENDSWSETTFGANIVSNEWNETTGEGVITFDGEVTTIGWNAFGGCNQLTSITIPNGVTAIGPVAFYGCFLDKIIIPKSVTSLGAGAVGYNHAIYFTSEIPVPFEDFALLSGDEESIDQIYVPYQSIELYRSEFYSYNSMILGYDYQNDTIYTGDLTCIKYTTTDNAALNVSGHGLLVSNYTDGEGYLYFNVPASSDFELDFTMFSSKTQLKSIELPENTTTIGEFAFENCSNLESINVPNSVLSIGESAFKGCSSLKEITIPESVSSIGESAFKGCSSLKEITIPESVSSIGEYAFSQCGGCATIHCNIAGGVFGAFEGASFTSVCVGENVTSIGANAFRNCKLLTNVQLPSGLETIGERAFYDSPLQSINIPSSVQSIGVLAFSSCNNETKVYISDLEAWCNINFGGVDANPLGLLYLNNVLLDEIAVPKVVKSHTFEDCANNATFIISDISSIGILSFDGCTGNLIINGNLPVDSTGAFEYGKFSQVKINNGVTCLGKSTFKGCTGELYLNSSLPGIVEGGEYGDQVFYSADFTKVTIGDDVTELSGDASYWCHCDQIKEVYVSSLDVWMNIQFGSADCSPLSISGDTPDFYINNELVTEIVIPNGVTEIRDYTFYNLKLSSVIIPEGVERIGESSFSGNNFTTITLPESIKYIGDSAFYSETLKEIYCKAKTPPTINIGPFPYQRCYYVPASDDDSIINAYINAQYWDYYNGHYPYSMYIKEYEF